MRRLNNVPPVSQKTALRLKFLVVVMASLMAAPLSNADTEKKKIGDLEIYKAAEGGKVTITMMLDTSGSMTMDQVNYACDLPAGTSYTKGSEMSETTPKYKRNYCDTTATSTKYFFREDTKTNPNTWHRCGNTTTGENTYNIALCNTVISKPVLDSTYRYLTSTTNNNYYYKAEGSYRVYDRITRLKDALFALMDDVTLDPKKVAIGLGQYSSQSGSDNNVKFSSNGTAANTDGSSGKILLTAALLDDAQRQRIRNVVAAAGAGNGTPTANAYAEVGAYMLGTKTSGTGSGFAKSTSDSKSGGNYISPLSTTVTNATATCDGRGIYFLTDGAPNGSSSPLTLMRTALGNNSFSVTGTQLPSGTEGNNGMPQVGAFAKALRSPTLNPLGEDGDILTAVVGFGSSFDVDKVADAQKLEKDRVIRTLTYIDAKGAKKVSDFYNCEKIDDSTNAGKDAKNACNWGAKSHPLLPGVGGFGEGGFYSAQSTDDIVNSITTFVSDLNQSLPTTPSGTIVIPNDPYRADSQLAVAYYPTLQPKVSDNAVIWEGNMKKYNLSEGTLYGKGKVKLFKNEAGELNKTAPDLWSDEDYLNANDKVESGGFYAQLNTPNTGVASIRNLYIEDWKSKTDQTTMLKKLGVNGSGKITIDNMVLSLSSFNDKATYDLPTMIKLLKFLGFDRIPEVSATGEIAALTSANATKPIKVVGATIHSTPASVSYSATLDESGKVTDKRDDYVLFGSSEGGLHLVNADNYSESGDGGKEKFVIIPREMLRDSNKSDALVKDSVKGDIGSPNFGVDAPWLVTADYKYDFDNKKVSVDKDNNKGIYAYGGLRMGGEAFYGINLNDKNKPSMMFSITPQTSGFSRMGQIWSKPTQARIKTSAADKGTDVLIFGGGYDMCYEDEAFQVGIEDVSLGACSKRTSARGNAVYIINANTGALIWSASSESATTNVSDMKNSIVGGITTLDRDNDGFMDHIYFADLGGQLFRADFTNADFVKPVEEGKKATAETDFSNTRVTRILKSSHSITDKKYDYRFYERPVVSFYRNRNSNGLFALVNIISGDRSSPLSTMRDGIHPDRLYGILDSDVTKADNIFYASDFNTTSGSQKIVGLGDTTLVSLPLAIGNPSNKGYSEAEKNKVIDELESYGMQGWYYPLTRFDGYNNVRYTKGMGKSEVIDSFLYTTVYNPDMSYGTTDSCTAKIVGGSERQLYCLPYGICNDPKSKNGTAGYMRAGQGIQELTLGPRSSEATNQRLLIGTQTLTERADTNSRFDFGGDGVGGINSTKKDANSPINERQTNAGLLNSDGTAPEMIFHERFTLQPKIWYEVD